ncbi:tRNA guanosine(34) transglycosylase Tgt [Helicobacter cetorum]|uniref:Queuine tRNA-ribosyltransferase n=1 Tax=Helicobacter cetorum (strain ATCC BAA-540 / CCUG 52418 / MIT 99-5656) TaxID=1163745 RepID=I0ERB3_HELCM|nr:tRNA guanosine(34) transglycosylase Tgt [Helicobacter cetorum]AFI05482.1 queuine tRNA-ribosyltransferase [Helicobacter cetorum MIT 99-5656]
MNYQLQATDNHARAGVLELAHSSVETPIFMPVGTQGCIKSLDANDMQEHLNAKLILANTYHMYLRPGEKIVENLGGLHHFSQFQGSFLTDSGGFQAFSLNSNVKLQEDGIIFKSHIDGSKHYFTPTKVLDIQYALNSDIMMVLDDLVGLPAPLKRIEESIIRSAKWANLSLEYHKEKNRPNNHLFAIIQGGTNLKMRSLSVELTHKDFDGYAIGGLAVGESANEMYETIAHTAPLLPKDKPRYLMGVGTPENILEAISLGVDMFDCVMPTRNARNATLFTHFGKISIKNAQYKTDNTPIEENCSCYTCKRYSKAYLHHLFKAKELTYARLASLHNLHFYLELTKNARKAILEKRFLSFKKEFLENYRSS